MDIKNFIDDHKGQWIWAVVFIFLWLCSGKICSIIHDYLMGYSIIEQFSDLNGTLNWGATMAIVICLWPTIRELLSQLKKFFKT